MPAAIPLAVGLGATAAAGAAAAAGTATILGLTATAWTAVSVGLSIVGTLAQTLLQQTPAKPKMQDGDVSIKQAIPPRVRGYGRQRVGGTFLFYDSTPDGDLKTLVCHVAHEIDAWEEDWLNDERVTLDGGGNVTDDPWWQGDDSVVVIQHYLGSPTQVIPPFDDKWTAAHHAQGLCCAYVKYSDLKDEEQVKVFPSGPPPYRAVLRLAKIYDPRPAAGQTAGNESTYTWSDNSALVVLDFMTRAEQGVPVGFGIPLDRVDLNSFAASADICDQSVALKAGGTEKRWRTWGLYELTEDRKAVLQDLLDACGGRIIQGPDGKLGLTVGAPGPTATVTLSDSEDAYHILEWDLNQGKSAIERINEVRATYVSQAWEWAETEAGIQLDQDAQDRNGVESSQIKLRFVPSESQAQRVAKEVLKRGNPSHAGRIRTTLAGLNAWGDRWVRLQIAELDIDAVFEITSMSLNQADMTVTMEVASYDGWWEWNAATDEKDPAVPPPETDDDDNMPVPENVAVAIEHRLINGQSYAAIGVISWDPPPRTVYVGRARYRPVTTPASPWQVLYAEQDENTVSTPPLTDGQGYEAQARFIGPRGSPSDWSASVTFTAVADPIAPDTPVGLTAQANVPSAGQVTVTATQPNNPRAAALRFYRNSSNTFAGAALLSGMPLYAGPGSTRSAIDTPGGGDWWYFATSANWSSVQSTPAGGVLAEIAPPAPVLTISTATVGQTNPPITGTSVPGASIKVFANAVLNTTTTADGSGNWSVAAIALGSGAQAITATATIAGNESAASGSVTLTVVWWDPDTDTGAHANFKSNLARLNGSTSSLTALFGTITTSAQIVTNSDGSLAAIAANALPLSDRGLEVWETRTNRCTNRNAAPSDLTGVTLSGDAAATLTRVDDSATMVGSSILTALKAAGTLNGFVYKLDNSAGTTDAFATISGTIGATGACRGSVVYRGSAGRIEIGGNIAVSFGASTPYVRTGGSRTAAATTEQMRIAAPAGAVIWFILNQLEAGAFDTAPIVVNAAIATRNTPVIRRSLSTDFNATQGFLAAKGLVASGAANNGIILRIQTPDTTHEHVLQALTTTGVTGVTVDTTTQAAVSKSQSMTTTRTMIYGWKANDFALAVDATTPATDTSGTVPSNSSPFLEVATNNLNGIIEQVKWATAKPSNAAIQSKSGWTTL